MTPPEGEPALAPPSPPEGAPPSVPPSPPVDVPPFVPPSPPADDPALEPAPPPVDDPVLVPLAPPVLCELPASPAESLLSAHASTKSALDMTIAKRLPTNGIVSGVRTTER
jgi:hypothetical protein